MISLKDLYVIQIKRIFNIVDKMDYNPRKCVRLMNIKRKLINKREGVK